MSEGVRRWPDKLGLLFNLSSLFEFSWFVNVSTISKIWLIIRITYRLINYK